MEGLFAIGYAVLLVLAILWLILPFALFGMKALLRDLIYEQRRTNALLERLMSQSTTRPLGSSDTAASPVIRTEAEPINAARDDPRASNRTAMAWVITAVIVIVVLGWWWWSHGRGGQAV